MHSWPLSTEQLPLHGTFDNTAMAGLICRIKMNIAKKDNVIGIEIKCNLFIFPLKVKRRRLFKDLLFFEWLWLGRLCHKR
jgi:hypothetical protein